MFDKIDTPAATHDLAAAQPVFFAPKAQQSPVKVGLVQINNSFSGQNYLPYSIACLRSYLESHAAAPKRYQFLPMAYKRQSVQKIVEQMAAADIVGFSTYVWNANISLEVARRLKASHPGICIVFGGPQVPDKPEAFLRKNRMIDVVVHNEGERTFLNLLERFPGRDWRGINGISYLDSDGACVRTPPAERMKDLAELPSPFLNGVFDQLMAGNPDEKWIGLWETNRGCPFQCTFCDWGSATASKVGRFEMSRLDDELAWFVKNHIEYIFVCDANFGSQKRDVDIAQRIADLRRQTGFPQGFSVQSTKNATERAYLTQKILSDAGLNKGVALSMQSLDETTLRNIKRDNISLDTYFELSRRFTREKVETFSDLILGLPGETYESFVKGVGLLIDSGQHNRIQFNNLAILPNAEMGDPDYLAKYAMRTVQCEIINIHGSKEALIDDVAETQDIVIETYSLSAADWRRTRAIAWMIALLYFDKLAQMPIVLLKALGKVPYKDIFEAFINVDAQYPVLAGIRDFFLERAQVIQDGGAEYAYAENWLGIFWPADEYVYIQLTAERRLDDFYAEAGALLKKFLAKIDDPQLAEVMEDALRINHRMVSQPGLADDIALSARYNVVEFWRGVCADEPVALVKGGRTYKILRSRRRYDDFQRWCQEIVWWGNKKGAYLYPLAEEPSTDSAQQKEMAGHY